MTQGIAGAYLIGPLMVQSPSDVEKLNFLSTGLLLVLLICTLPLPSVPITPPSRSSHLKEKDGIHVPPLICFLIFFVLVLLFLLSLNHFTSTKTSCGIVHF